MIHTDGAFIDAKNDPPTPALLLRRTQIERPSNRGLRDDDLDSPPSWKTSFPGEWRGVTLFGPQVGNGRKARKQEVQILTCSGRERGRGAAQAEGPPHSALPRKPVPRSHPWPEQGPASPHSPGSPPHHVHSQPISSVSLLYLERNCSWEGDLPPISSVQPHSPR